MAAPKRIDELTAVTSLSAAAAVAIVQGGQTLRATAAQFITEAPSYTASGTGALPENVQAALRKGWVFADSYSGASVTAKINAAMAAASGRIVIIPPDIGAGEATTYAVSQPTIDLRAGTPLSGAKIVLNGSDANGFNRFMVLDDQTNPTLSNAAALISHRATGTLPDNRNGEGAQFVAGTTGALSNSPTGYILSAVEAGCNVNSTGQTLPKVWGLHAYADTETGSTTNVTELASMVAVAPAKRGTGTITNAYSLIVEDPGSIGSTVNLALWCRGAARFGGDITLDRGGTSSNSSFLSGGATNYYHIDVGNSASRLRLAVAGAANDFISGAAQNDGMLFTLGANTLWLGTGGGIGQVKINHTASAARQVTLTGSAAGNPAISVTAGELSVGTNAWTFGIANTVSPTSPNRTLTVTIGGTTYYIHAKTTND